MDLKKLPETIWEEDPSMCIICPMKAKTPPYKRVLNLQSKFRIREVNIRSNFSNINCILKCLVWKHKNDVNIFVLKKASIIYKLVRFYELNLTEKIWSKSHLKNHKEKVNVIFLAETNTWCSFFLKMKIKFFYAKRGGINIRLIEF